MAMAWKDPSAPDGAQGIRTGDSPASPYSGFGGTISPSGTRPSVPPVRVGPVGPPQGAIGPMSQESKPPLPVQRYAPGVAQSGAQGVMTGAPPLKVPLPPAGAQGIMTADKPPIPQGSVWGGGQQNEAYKPPVPVGRYGPGGGAQGGAAGVMSGAGAPNGTPGATGTGQFPDLPAWAQPTNPLTEPAGSSFAPPPLPSFVGQLAGSRVRPFAPPGMNYVPSIQHWNELAPSEQAGYKGLIDSTGGSSEDVIAQMNRLAPKPTPWREAPRYGYELPRWA